MSDPTLSLHETANSIEIQTEDGTIVADLINEADCCVTESMRQYASLFAAAPDMLAALKGMAKLLSGSSPFYLAKLGSPITNGEQANIDSVFIAIDTAIAKAGTQ